MIEVSAPILIRNVGLFAAARADVRIEQGRIAAIGKLQASPHERVIDAHGGLLLPGLHDHHCHLAATVVHGQSVQCGPPEVENAVALAKRLVRAGKGWLRGVGYHESVAGILDRAWLDQIVSDRPIRIQHRGGRMWFFNSAGLAILHESGLPQPPGLDNANGRLFDEDAWLRRALKGRPPSLAALSQDLAAFGITGVTDMNPSNGPAARTWLVDQALPQRIMVAGQLDLTGERWDNRMLLGPVKVHLHEEQLLDIESFVLLIKNAHAHDRGVAIHCVTEVELVYALAALRDAGLHPGDRIEHASVTPDMLLAQILDLGVSVVAQPLFPFERGDIYRRDIPSEEWPLLYRLRSFLNAGVPLAAGSDAPYGSFDPWAAMAAAVARRTRSGALLGEAEALKPEEAMSLYLADPADVSQKRHVAVGETADLCLLDRSWNEIQDRFSAKYVRMTLMAGAVIYERSLIACEIADECVDQSPP